MNLQRLWRRTVWRTLVLLGFLLPPGTAVAITVAPPTFAELVQTAQQIAEVEIVGRRCQWDSTPTGERVIHTYVKCAVRRVLKGQPSADIELRFLGGDVPPDHMHVPDMPELVVGSSYVLFIGENGRAFCPLPHVMHGAFPIVEDASTGERCIRRLNGSGLRSPEQVQSALSHAGGHADPTGMTVDQFAAAIRNEVARQALLHEK